MERITKNFLDKTNKDDPYEKEFPRKNIEGQEESDEDCCCNESDDENDCGCLNKKENSITGKEKTTTDVLKQVGWFIGETALITGIGVVGMSVLPSLLGFTAGGVAARSVAAMYQSRFLGGTIVKGGLFSVMQRIGVKGFATSTKVLVGAGASMLSTIHSASAASTSLKKNENQSQSSNIRGNKKKCTCKRSQMKTKIVL